jgi:Cdc6-like AAA superfamily ATPase
MSLTCLILEKDRQRIRLLQRKGPDADEIIEKIPNACMGTLEWFFDLEKFRYWKLSSLSCSIWIRGSPGQGKSVLAKRIVTKLKTETSDKMTIGVLYFFCYNQHERFRSANAILRGLIVQLLEDQRNIPDILDYT